MRKRASIIILFLFTILNANAQIEGYWKGKLDLGLQKMEMCFNIEATESGFSATMDVPSQGGFDVPVEETTFQENQLNMTMSELVASYTGVLKDSIIEGKFTQHGSSFTLDLKKGLKEGPIVRPQDPQPPFNYRIEEVSFVNGKEGNTLTGTLTIPEGKGPFKAVILVSGSGQQNRDEEIEGHRPFWVIADYLTRRGIAVLRYDDRGIGGSTGEVMAATSLDFSYDTEAAFDYLRSRKEINGSQIGILGHSEGGIINFMVSARRPEVAFLISLAGPAVNGIEISKAQSEAMLRASGLSEEMIAFTQNSNKQLFDIVEASNDREEADSLMRKLVKSWGYNEELTEQTVGRCTLPWMYYFMKYDPTDAIVKTNCPVLLLNGSKDLQVLVTQNFPVYEKIIADYGKTNLTLRELPDLNHLFQHCDTGLLEEYSDIDETISPEVLEIIADFVKTIE